MFVYNSQIMISKNTESAIEWEIRQRALLKQVVVKISLYKHCTDRQADKLTLPSLSPAANRKPVLNN